MSSIRIVVQPMDGSFCEGEPMVFESPTFAGAIRMAIKHVDKVIAPNDDDRAADIFRQLLPVLGKLSEKFCVGDDMAVESDRDMDGTGIRVTMLTEVGINDCREYNQAMVGKRVTNLKPDGFDDDGEDVDIPVGSVGIINSINHELPDGSAAFNVAWTNGGVTVYDTSEFGVDIEVVESPCISD